MQQRQTTIAIAVAFSVWTAGAAFAATTGPQGKILNAVMRGLKLQQQAVGNIKLTAVSKHLGWNGKTIAPEAGPTDVTAVLTPGGRFRLHVHDLFGGYNPILQRNFSYGEVVCDLAYNGRVGTAYTEKSGRLGNVQLIKIGSVSGGPPPIAAGYYRGDTGWAFTVWGILTILDFDHHAPAYRRATLLEFLQKPPRLAKISARFVRSPRGRRLVALTVRWQSEDIILLDPRRDFAVLGDRQYFAIPPKVPGGKIRREPKLTDFFTVTSFWHPAKSVYYPKHVVTVSYARKIRASGPIEKTILHVTAFRVNDPKVGAKTFIVHFPVGATVTDESTGRTYRIGGTPGQQITVIKRAVAAARRAIATQPSPQGGGK
ncbi:MAG: hypothetical protein ACYCUV_02930 [Phycisphaerae bacterium]